MLNGKMLTVSGFLFCSSRSDIVFFVCFVLVAVKYTDIDYVVFTDAARFVSNGGSPYERSTYRYTPLLAYLLVGNVRVHAVLGKLLFVVCDLVIGVLLHVLARTNGESKVVTPTVCSALWLLNPIVIAVSTRGNAESVIGVLVLLSLWLLQTRRIVLGSIVYGLAVHFKIYPVIYSFALLLWLGDGTLSLRLRARQIKFALVSGLTFVALTGAMYHLYGLEFLDETYLYHVYRSDNRHNFSVYFYQLYLQPHAATVPLGGFVKFAAFLPQLAILVVLTLRTFRHIALCLFVQTLTFVAFNKVCTVQYFIWYFPLFALIAPNLTSLGTVRSLVLLAMWYGAQLFWLMFAYRLEFLGQNTFLHIWFAGLVFFVSNITIAVTVLLSYTTSPSVDKSSKKKNN